MLFIVQYPITDLRSMFEDRAGRLDAPAIRKQNEGHRYPDWLGNYSYRALNGNFGFVRNFGKFGRRQAGGILEAPGIFGESNMSSSNRGIRCHVPLAYSDGVSSTRVPLWILFRRLYFDGFSTGRIEIGITNHRDWQNNPPPGLALDLTAVIQSLAGVPVTVHDDIGGTQETSLLEAHGALTISLLSSTTAHSERKKSVPDLIGKGFWVGSPSLYVRLASNEQLKISSGFGAHTVRDDKNHQLKVVIPDSGTPELSVWVQEYDLGDGLLEMPTEREIRVLLSRFLAEQQTVACLEGYLAANLDKVNHSKFAAAFFDRFIAASVLRLEGLSSANPQDGKALSAAKLASLRALMGSDRDMLEKLRQLARLRAEAKNKKQFFDYLTEGGKFVVETAMKVGAEALLKAGAKAAGLPG